LDLSKRQQCSVKFPTSRQRAKGDLGIAGRKVQMNIIRSGRWGLVLDSESLASKKFRANSLRAIALKGDQEHGGHFILERYTVDNDGNICVTPTLAMSELYASLDIMKAELEGLLEEARRRFPEARSDQADHVSSFMNWGAMTPRRN
jgi:hypothetical protein